jgi:hypothetical protein
LGTRDQIVIGHNTKLELIGNHEIAATYHGNEIVRYSPEGVEASWAGWETPTTTNRLNMLAPGSFRIHKRSANLNGETVDAYGWHKVS